MPKCRVCKENIKSKQDFIKLTKTTYYHTDCYRQRELSRLTEVDEIEATIIRVKEEYKQEVKDKKNMPKTNEGQHEFIQWVQENYDITTARQNFGK